MLTWSRLLDIELRNRGNEDVAALLADLADLQDVWADLERVREENHNLDRQLKDAQRRLGNLDAA